MRPEHSLSKCLATKVKLLVLCCQLTCWCSLFAWASAAQAKLSANEQKIQQIMAHFQVPGVAIGVLKGDKIVSATGYGQKNIHTGAKVDADTIFKIGSNSKAFTVAALAILVDEGKITWDTPVVSLLEDFKLHDPWITAHFTITDLLTHRSGLGLGAGDLMLWPEPSSFSRQEVVHNLRYLKAQGQFRADYAYDNLLYIVAGEIIPAVTGIQWQSFVQQRIIKELGMQHCYAHNPPRAEQQNLALPHGLVNGQLQTIIRPTQPGIPSVSAAAGGIQCSLNDLLIWAKLWLRQGQTPKGVGLFSANQHRQMWSAETIMPLSQIDKRYNQGHFSAYGLGWRLNDVDGYLRVHHSGSLAGMYSAISFFPELDLSIVVLTNQQSANARDALMYTTMKPYLGDSQTDWLAVFAAKAVAAKSSSAQITLAVQSPIPVEPGNPALQEYQGQYRDPWLGAFFFELHGERLQLRSDRVIKLLGGVYPSAEKDRFMIRWDDRSLEADVYAQFSRNEQGRISALTLIPVAAEIDFSYDFQDLNLIKVDN